MDTIETTPTDLEQCRALLDRLEIEYIYHGPEKAFTQGNESLYSVIELVQLCSRYTHKWFFYDEIEGKGCEWDKTPGQYMASDPGMLSKQWWPLKEEGETRPYYLD